MTVSEGSGDVTSLVTRYSKGGEALGRGAEVAQHRVTKSLINSPKLRDVLRPLMCL